MLNKKCWVNEGGIAALSCPLPSKPHMAARLTFMRTFDDDIQEPSGANHACFSYNVITLTIWLQTIFAAAGLTTPQHEPCSEQGSECKGSSAFPLLCCYWGRMSSVECLLSTSPCCNLGVCQVSPILAVLSDPSLRVLLSHPHWVRVTLTRAPLLNQVSWVTLFITPQVHGLDLCTLVGTQKKMHYE